MVIAYKRINSSFLQLFRGDLEEREIGDRNRAEIEK
jgi:hypothetical protein